MAPGDAFDTPITVEIGALCLLRQRSSKRYIGEANPLQLLAVFDAEIAGGPA
jgi:hypothetical protein